MSEDSIKISNLTMRILFESGLYSNADSIQDFTVYESFFQKLTQNVGSLDPAILAWIQVRANHLVNNNHTCKRFYWFYLFHTLMSIYSFFICYDLLLLLTLEVPISIAHKIGQKIDKNIFSKTKKINL